MKGVFARGVYSRCFAIGTLVAGGAGVAASVTTSSLSTSQGITAAGVSASSVSGRGIHTGIGAQASGGLGMAPSVVHAAGRGTAPAAPTEAAGQIVTVAIWLDGAKFAEGLIRSLDGHGVGRN